MNIFYGVVKRSLRAFRKFLPSVTYKKGAQTTSDRESNRRVRSGGGRRGRRTSTAQRRTIGNPLLELQDVPRRRGGTSSQSTPRDKDLWSWKFEVKEKLRFDSAIIRRYNLEGSSTKHRCWAQCYYCKYS